MASPPAPTAVADLKLLGDETRLKILILISEKSLNVTELAGAMGMGQNRVSTQIKLLRVAGILTLRREGKCNYYGVTKKYGRLVEAVLALAERMEEREPYHC